MICKLMMGGLLQLVRLDADWIPEREGCALYIRPFMFAVDESIPVKSADTYKFIIFACPVDNTIRSQ